ncbi:MAG: pyrrolysine--tRNA(Pyl) ligase large subunit [Anaerovoracaceae bacterium]|jgi:pyrrolysyl-tRNA synthetase-like protein
MSISFTVTQKERLTELNAAPALLDKAFNDEKERNKYFLKIEKEYVKANRQKLKNILNNKHLPDSLIVQMDLQNWLTEELGFTQVQTPTIISSSMLDKMTITKDNPLYEQVFWLDSKKCLRPMLAPNLYVIMREVLRISNEPVKIFEVGSCFRKESQGAQHMNEFTMLNMVEVASVEEGKQMERLEYIAREAMKAVGITDYELVREESTVYGETLDVVVDGIEVGSGSYGPHTLDAKWNFFDVWVGFGFGIERLALVKNKYQTIKRIGRSTAFLDGIPLNI